MSRKRKRTEKKNQSASSAPPPWVELPVEITTAILQKLGPVEMMSTAKKVCRVWRNVCRDTFTWRSIHIPDPEFTTLIQKASVLGKRTAIDRSQGHLIDIHINCLFADKLLRYMSHRRSQLKCLQLVICLDIKSDCLIQTMKSFPLLEEMLVYFCGFDSECIEATGRSCPRLKSFTLDNYWNRFKCITEIDVDAHAIAETMPQLRHLSVIGKL